MKIPGMIICFMVLCSIGSALDPEAGPQKADMPTLDPADPPAVMLYTTPGMELPPPPPKPGEEPMKFEFNRVQVAAWSDGRVIWSHDLKRGGAPYYSGRIDRDRVMNVYRILEHETSGTRQKRTSSSIPDAPFQNIVILNSDGVSGIKWQSAHPVFEDNKKVVYTSTGVVMAADYKPPESPNESELEFQNFRKDFDLLKAAILKLPPGQQLRFE